MKSITPKELQQLITDKKDVQLIDVREPDEHSAFNIGGELMPLGEITSHLEKIQKDKPVIVYCRKGIRSQFAIQKLQEKFPFDNLYNLVGGTEAWKKMAAEV
ncbi:MAG: rhodanese-like domain-containing protein [Bacteroidota bacterium]